MQTGTDVADLEIVVLVLGCAANLLLIAGIFWSIFQPERRVWPPAYSTAAYRTFVWALTCGGFGSTIALGLLEWGGRSTSRGPFVGVWALA